jgi:hypothetical protein
VRELLDEAVDLSSIKDRVSLTGQLQILPRHAAIMREPSGLGMA